MATERKTIYQKEADINFAMAVAEQGGIAIQKAIDHHKPEQAD